MLSLMFQKKDIYIFIIADILKDWNELAWLTSYQRKHRGKVIKFWLMGKTFSDKTFLQTIFSRFLFIHWNVWFFNYFAFIHYDIRMKLRCQYVLRSLTLSRRRPLPYRNQSTDLRSKSMDWFLYDNGLRLEGVKSWSGGKYHRGNVWLSPFKKTSCHFRTRTLSLLSTTSKVYLVKGMTILHEKEKLSFWH